MPDSTMERLFGLKAAGTTARKELVAGLTTFLTLAYIVVVNPAILAEAGIPHGAALVATCIAGAVGCLVMGLWANLPIALAPGMGLNAYFTYTVVLGMGLPWQTALGAVFVAGVIFLGLSLTPLRERLIDAIPPALRHAISAGIGLLLAVIALQKAGIIAANPATMVGLGDVTSPHALIAGGALLVIIALDARRIPGAVMVGILGASVAALLLGEATFQGIASAPPDPTPTLLAMDVGAVFDAALIGVVVSFLFVDLFDTAGTLIGVTQDTEMVDADGRIRNLNRALLADSTATVVGAALGTSTVTSYVESAAGIRAGGRTGLTAVVVAACLVACIFLAPLVSSVPDFAVAPALLFIAASMMRGLARVDWDDAGEFVAAVVTTLGIGLAFSIATGIGLGILTWVGARLLTGRARTIGVGPAIIAGLFVVKFAVL